MQLKRSSKDYSVTNIRVLKPSDSDVPTRVVNPTSRNPLNSFFVSALVSSVAVAVMAVDGPGGRG